MICSKIIFILYFFCRVVEVLGSKAAVLKGPQLTGAQRLLSRGHHFDFRYPKYPPIISIRSKISYQISSKIHPMTYQSNIASKRATMSTPGFASLPFDFRQARQDRRGQFCAVLCAKDYAGEPGETWLDICSFVGSQILNVLYTCVPLMIQCTH